MPHRPSPISWSSIALARRPHDPAVIAARRAATRTAAFAALAADSAARACRTRPLVVAGAYDRAAIMAAACEAAKARQGVTGEAWSVCMAGALRGAWQVAKAIRARTAH